MEREEKSSKGSLALDIDGTLTADVHSIPKEVLLYLEELYQKGWQLLFLTGRTFSFAQAVLKELKVPYILAPQQGADVLEMPAKRLLSRAYLTEEALSHVANAHAGMEEDFLVYTGYERGDFCYYRPHLFSKQMQEHLKKLEAISPEPWQAVDQFRGDKAFPLIKCLGSKEAMEKLNGSLKRTPSLHATLARDPLGEKIYLNLVTHSQATKGSALQKIVKLKGLKGPIIAAGDDWNDQSMLEIADVRIVMEGAPTGLLPLADFIAKPAREKGILAALEEAISDVD